MSRNVQRVTGRWSLESCYPREDLNTTEDPRQPFLSLSTSTETLIIDMPESQVLSTKLSGPSPNPDLFPGEPLSQTKSPQEKKTLQKIWTWTSSYTKITITNKALLLYHV